jgi:phage shock protein C
MDKRLYLSNTDKKIAGVCGGIAEYFNIDATLVRILWVLFMFFGGSGILAYIICALIIPKKPEVL